MSLRGHKRGFCSIARHRTPTSQLARAGVPSRPVPLRLGSTWHRLRFRRGIRRPSAELGRDHRLPPLRPNLDGHAARHVARSGGPAHRNCAVQYARLPSAPEGGGAGGRCRATRPLAPRSHKCLQTKSAFLWRSRRRNAVVNISLVRLTRDNPCSDKSRALRSA